MLIPEAEVCQPGYLQHLLTAASYLALALGMWEIVRSARESHQSSKVLDNPIALRTQEFIEDIALGYVSIWGYHAAGRVTRTNQRLVFELYDAALAHHNFSLECGHIASITTEWTKVFWCLPVAPCALRIVTTDGERYTLSLSHRELLVKGLS